MLLDRQIIMFRSSHTIIVISLLIGWNINSDVVSHWFEIYNPNAEALPTPALIEGKVLLM
jgi:hypothetical protein